MEDALTKLLFKSFLVLCLLTGTAFAAQTVNFGASSGIELTDQDQTGVTMEMNIGAVDFFPIDTKQGTFTLMTIKGFTRSHNVGEPNLPMINKLLSIPFGSELSVEVISSETEEISLSDLGFDNPIMPTQPSLSKSEDPEFVEFEYNEPIYERNETYALPLVDGVVKGTMRSVHLGLVSMAPVQYNPVENTITVHKKMTVRVNYLHPDYNTTELMQSEFYSPFFEPVFGRVINYTTPVPEILDDLTRYPIKYIIVSDRQFESQLQPFIDWKTKKGFEVITAYTDEIGGSLTQIKSYIQGVYNNSNPKPSFVLFVGDTPQIPTWDGDHGYHVTDLKYCEFTGDIFPEIYYGRWSAQNPGQLQPQIDKTLMYEQYTMPDPSYLGEVTMIAGVDSWNAPTYGNGQINYGTNLYFNSAHGIYSHTWLYPASDDPGAAAAIIQTVDEGIGYINYTAHCGHTGFSDPSFTVSDINGLTNYGMYLLAVGNCCSSNTFDESTPCFGEAWLQAQDKGGVGYIGASNSTYWDEDYWWGVGYGPVVGNGPTYEETGLGAYDGVFHDHGEPVSDHYVTNDAIIYCGNLAVTESGSSREGYYWEAYHLMGDPSIMNYMGVPDANNVSHDSAIPLVATYFTVNADPYSYVGISKDGVLHGAAYIDESGSVNVPITVPFDEPGYANVVVCGQNKVPYDVQVPIIADGYGAIAGRVTDLVTGNGLQGQVIVTNRDPQIYAQCNEQGYYTMHVPADTLWNLRAEYTSDYLPSFANVTVTEDDTVTQNFALEPKVEVILKAQFGNPGDIGYRDFYLRGSWDDDGFYNAGWSGGFITMKDDGVAPDQYANDGIYTGSVLLATDLSNTYEWAVYSENYNDHASRLQYGASFDITDPGNPPTVPTLMVNPSGGENNWTITAHEVNSGLEFDMTAGYSGQDHIWYGTVFIPGGISGQYIIKVMHSDVAHYGQGGVGGAPIPFSTTESGNYTFFFNDDIDVASTGASLAAKPGFLDVDLTPGNTTTREIVLKNDGELDLNFEIPDEFEVVLANNDQPEIVEVEELTSYEYNGPKPLTDDAPAGQPQSKGQGGPDNYGYKWIDSDEPGGPAYNWVDITGVGTPLNMSDDDNEGPFSLPFNFNFYGNDFNSFRVCSNGWVSFTSTSTSYYNYPIPGDGPENMIAAMWDDFNPSAGGQVYYYISNDSAIVSWVDVPHYYDTGNYSFQIIMLNGGGIVCQYETLNGDVNSATVGIQNDNLTDGLQVVYNAAYLHDNMAIKFSAGWVEVDPLSGVIPAGGELPLTVTFDAGALTTGDYQGQITVHSWDNMHTLPDMMIPLDLHVLSSLPDLSLAMQPNESPVEIYAGGTFDYTILLTNNTGSTYNFDAWLMIELPNHTMYGPLMNVPAAIGADQTLYYYGTQWVPTIAPPGEYGYHSYVGDYPNEIDHATFPFTVLSGTPVNMGVEEWNVDGFFQGDGLLREGEGDVLPTSFSLSQNYPNPFNAQSVIEYALPVSAKVELTVFNLLGQKVETLVNSNQQAGYHSVTWDASQYASGIYFYKLNAGDKVFTRQMTLLK
ncbi:MAG: T9SS type A sorting domain-containing protein [candidate division Zixibacteria bacterium]|nr:T9SS type A sorting domain-containing protein [candidate division Zixibacteria bacterium]